MLGEEELVVAPFALDKMFGEDKQCPHTVDNVIYNPVTSGEVTLMNAKGNPESF